MTDRALNHPSMMLAAGQGLRLRPMTANRPKALVEVAGRPIIDRLLAGVFAAGAPGAVVNLFYRGDMLFSHLSSQWPGRLSFSREEGELLETGGGVKHALSLLGRGPRLIVNSDVIWRDGSVHGERTLTRLSEAFDPNRMDVLLLICPLASVIDSDRSGNIHLSDTPVGPVHLRSDQPAPPLTHAFGGVQIVNTSLYDAMPDGPFSNRLIWQRARAEGRLFGLLLEGMWCHLRDPEALAMTNAFFAGAGEADPRPYPGPDPGPDPRSDRAAS